MNYAKEKECYVSFCGSYCKHCDWFTGRIRKTFQAASDALELYGFARQLGDEVDRGSLKLWLETLACSGICPGCKAETDRGSGDRCQVRQCALGRGVQLCSECSDFPCPALESNPGVVKFGCIQNLVEIRDRGFEPWVDRQWLEHVRA